MKNMRLLLANACGLALVLALLMAIDLSCSEPVQAAPPPITRYVLDDGGVDVGDCADPNAPCKTVQYALSRASSGDTIRVANKFSLAVYVGTVVITKSVTLEGGWAAVPFPHGILWQRPWPCQASRTTLDALGAGRVISISGPIAPVIDCFTITGGDASGLGGDPASTVDNDAGGGIYGRDAAPIIINNIISANFGCDLCPVAYGRGGGVYLLNAPATTVISNNLIAYNVADESTWGQGGGLMLRNSDAQVLSNTIEHNRAGHSAGDGGGIVVKGGGPTIADNNILRNSAGTGVLCNGGGIFVSSNLPVTIERNFLNGNIAVSGTAGYFGVSSRGGGIYCAGDTSGLALIRDNTLSYNVAAPLAPHTGVGGAIYLKDLVTPSLVSQNTLEWNYAGHNHDGNGGGIYVADSEVTIADNDILALWDFAGKCHI